MSKDKTKKLAPRKKAIATRSVTDRELAVIERRLRARGDESALRLLDKVKKSAGKRKKGGKS